MSNDQKPPAKTIMGWVPNTGQAPGQPAAPQQPQWQPPQPAAPQPPAPQWGAPQPQPGAPPQWGAPQPPQPGAPPQWGAPQPPQPGAPPQWGAPQPPQPAWGGPPPGQQPGPGGQQPGFGGPPPGFGQQPGFGGGPPPGGGQQPGFGGGPPPGFGGGQPGFGGQQPGFGGGQPGFGGQQPGFGGGPGPGFGGGPGPGFGGQQGGQQPSYGDPHGYHQSSGPGGVGRGIPGADATVGVSARVRFIRLTYLHLLGAILLFSGLEYLFFTNATLIEKVSIPLTKFALGGRFNWAIVLGVFMATSWITHYLADHTRSKPLHYVGLVVYTLAEALIFIPLLAIVQYQTAKIIAKGGGDPNILRDAAIVTLGVFGALTASVFFTKKDFSFLRTALAIGGAAAMALIALSLIFGFNLGIVFAIAMVLLAAGQILYETSQVMAHHDPENYVGASLSLFASVALMFWYVIQILMKLRQ